MQVNSEIWGTSETLYEGYNLRTGADSLSDADFDEYAPFCFNKMVSDTDGLESYEQYALRSCFVKLGDDNPFELDNDYPDYSIAYVGMYNPNLPQCNIVCLGQRTDATSGDYTNLQEVFKSDPEEVKPIAFITNRYLRTLSGISTYTPVDAIWRNWYYSTSQGTYTNGKYVFSPHARDGYPAINTRNVSLDLGYWRSLGLRSMFGVIYVRYVDAELNETSGLPNNYNYPEVTLHYYTSQSDEWKAAHPIAGAYMRIVRRSTTAGAYTTINGTSAANNCIAPDLSQGVKASADYWDTLTETERIIITPASCITDGNNNVFPIFGGMQLTTGSVIQQVGTNANGGLTPSNLPCFVGYNIGILHQGIGTTNNRRSCWITTNDVESIMRGAAAYGIFFTDGNASDAGYAQLFAEGNDTYRFVDNNMCLGVVDSNGRTDGTYTRGLQNPTAPNWTWKDTTQSPYNPRIQPDKPNQYNDATTFNNIGNLATMFKRYVIDAANVEQLGRDLFKITADINTADVDDPTQYNVDINSSFLTNNPINCIISLKRFPLEIPSGSQAAENIKLGTHTCTAIGYPMRPTSYMFLYELADTIKPNFGDSFLDYSPYTEYELFVPFCGTVKLNPRDIIGRHLAVQSLVDFVTGTVTAFVMSNNLVIETVQGNIAIEIPVAGIDSATIAGNLNNAVANSKLAYTNTYQAAADLISVPKSVGGTFGKLAHANVTAPTQFAQAQYDLQHQQAEPHVIGSASPVGLWAIDLNCRLICYFPTGDIISVSNSRPYLNNKALDYGATTGFACLISDKTLGEFSGMTTAVNPLLGGQTTNNGKSLTADELTLLEKALQDGIIL